jgi:hypothetical protein
MVLDLKRKIAVAAESKSSDGTAKGSVEENKSSDATVLMSVEENNLSDGVAKGSVEENKLSDASAVESVLELVKESKSLDGTAKESVKESKPSDGTAEGSVEPAIVSLSALSAMSPSPGPKADEYQQATQYSPNQGPFTEKNRPRTQSTTSPDPKKKESPVSAVANESPMHSARNFDALVGMDSLSKAAFHMTLRFHKYTQAYLDHAYDIVHDFRKCDICVLHEIEQKKDCKPYPTEKPVEIGSPPSITTDSPFNQMVTRFPPTPDEFVYVEEDCMKYVHASGLLDIGCDSEAVDELVLSNLTCSSFQYTDYFDLIHDFSMFFDRWLTVDTVQFYQCWVSRSFGSYPKNIFLFPLDYYQATVEDVFEKYWNGIQPTFKKEFVKRMWRYVHPASYVRYKINIRKKKSGVTYPNTDLSPAAP